jgi:hypothetical protein
MVYVPGAAGSWKVARSSIWRAVREPLESGAQLHLQAIAESR